MVHGPHEVYSQNGANPINYLKSVFLCQHTQKRGIISCSSILIPNKLSNLIQQLSHSCDIESLVWIMFEGHGVFTYIILATRGQSDFKNISREEEKGQTHSMKGYPWSSGARVKSHGEIHSNQGTDPHPNTLPLQARGIIPIYHKALVP